MGEGRLLSRAHEELQVPLEPFGVSREGGRFLRRLDESFTRLRFRFEHVVVDETQDRSSAHWSLLRAMVDQRENDIFLVGDTHQRIYDNRVSLGALGINIRGRCAGQSPTMRPRPTSWRTVGSRTAASSGRPGPCCRESFVEVDPRPGPWGLDRPSTQRPGIGPSQHGCGGRGVPPARKTSCVCRPKASSQGWPPNLGNGRLPALQRAVLLGVGKVRPWPGPARVEGPARVRAE